MFFRVNQFSQRRSSSLSLRHLNDLYNNHLLEALRHRLLKKEIKITHTSNHLHLSHKSTNNHPKHQTKNFEFRFASSVSATCSLQWHLVSSLQRLMILFQWHFMTSSHNDLNKFVTTTSKAHAFNSLHLYESRKRWIHYTRYESNDMKSWKKRINRFATRSKQVRRLRNFLSSSMRQYSVNRFFLF